jgi:hypothetical protein
VRNPLGGRDDVRLAEVDGRTSPRRHRSTKPPVAIERGRENFDRDNAPEQTVVSVVHVRHPPEADQFPELTEPTRTALEPTTKQSYPGSGARGFRLAPMTQQIDGSRVAGESVPDLINHGAGG